MPPLENESFDVYGIDVQVEYDYAPDVSAEPTQARVAIHTLCGEWTYSWVTSALDSLDNFLETCVEEFCFEIVKQANS